MLTLMEATDVWTDFRKRVELLLELPGWNQARLCEEAGIGKSTLSMFLTADKGRGLRQSTYEKLLPVVDGNAPSPLRSNVESEIPGVARVRPDLRPVIVPVIKLRRIPTGFRGKEMLKRIEEESHRREFSPVPGHDAFFVEAETFCRLRKGNIEPGDLLLLSAAAAPTPGSAAVIEVFGDHQFADLEADRSGAMIAVLPDGSRPSSFVVKGIIKNRTQNWI